MPFWKPQVGTKFRDAFAHPLLAFGSTLLWGIVEFIALQRSQRAPRGGSRKSCPNHG